ncbi:MAG: hypothetical protein K2X93_10740 [Candidatus Obscuribacterales bacterium]|nr:hypothetical protein [Candidatus Obscuribacterales bacterium]
MKTSLTISVFTALILAVVSPLAGIGADPLEKPYDWTIEINTAKLDRHFEYEGSTLRPVSKADVTYYRVNHEDEKTNYEELWFHNGKALGLERKNKLEMEEGDGVAIKVVHKTSTPDAEELKAAADAISLLYLDAYLNRNLVVSVIVKDSTFNDILGCMQDQQWQVLPDQTDVAIDAQVILYLQSESAEQKKTLKYQSPS